MKKLFYTLAAMVPAVAAMAVIPQEERAGRDLNPEMLDNPVKVIKKAESVSSENRNSFFEGFEGRDPEGYGFIANAWLPSGWSQFSRQGNKHVKSGDGFWDLTWLTLSNESVGHLPSGNQTSSYEGDSFAYIMADVMWGEKPPYPDLGLDYATLHPQDEWLVSPAFTPGDEEWFYFQVEYRPGWCLYNREADDFSGENNLLEVYVTEGDGTTDSDWKLLWSLKDRIKEHYTDAELRADLSTFKSSGYDPIFVNVKDYVGKNVRIAFRYYGVSGQGMAIDNVALGIPNPKPSYVVPSGFFKQQSLTPGMKEITGTPQMLIPFGTEAVWKNTSKDILTQEWSYDAADGSRRTSDVYNLTTPAYEFGKSYVAPVLTGIFESRSSTYSTLYSAMQAGGRLHGTGANNYEGEMGVAHYDFLDPTGSLAQSSSQISFYNGLNEAWEMILGRMPNTIDIKGIGCTYPKTPIPYGFDYVDVFAQIATPDGQLDPETQIVVNVFRLPDNEYEESGRVIGQGMLTGSDINSLGVIEEGNYKNLRFKLNVPVVADGHLLVMLVPYNIVDEDKLVFPYMKSGDPSIWGNTVAYMYVYESEENGGTYDTFYNLNSYPLNKGHFAGLTMNLGAVYSYMESPTYDGDIVDLPYEGGKFELDIRSSMAPENWAITADGATKADWISFTAKVVGNDPELYHVTVEFAANPDADSRETEVAIRQAGSMVTLNVSQEGNPSGVCQNVASGKMTVNVAQDVITVDNVYGNVELFNATGAKVASVRAEGSVRFDRASLAAGVYIVRNGKSAVKVVL